MYFSKFCSSESCMFMIQHIETVRLILCRSMTWGISVQPRAVTDHPTSTTAVLTSGERICPPLHPTSRSTACMLTSPEMCSPLQATLMLHASILTWLAKNPDRLIHCHCSSSGIVPILLSKPEGLVRVDPCVGKVWEISGV